MSDPIRLHIGGKQVKPGWKILNIQAGPDVDYVGTCTDLGQFADGAVAEVYASHVLEHLGFREELPRALKEIHRVLAPGGVAMIAVPDLQVLCHLFLHPNLPPNDRFRVMRMMFGAQSDAHDFHKVGLDKDFLVSYLRQAGFQRVERVADFGLFKDDSTIQAAGTAISLNVKAIK